MRSVQGLVLAYIEEATVNVKVATAFMARRRRGGKLRRPARRVISSCCHGTWERDALASFDGRATDLDGSGWLSWHGGDGWRCSLR